MFRSNIGTWCKGTEKYGRGEIVTITITCKLLANYFKRGDNGDFFSVTIVTIMLIHINFGYVYFI